ncbi:MAG: ferritin-like domain-containing protein [Oscillospiraceae bacterium]|nr:ferritin-like domain-containing protein [Oscillospiraceae bacterium]
MIETAPSALPAQEENRRHESVWRRVSPSLDPYPDARAEEQAKLLTLPGAEADPCCMGSAARAALDVIEGFLRDELSDAQTYRYLAAHAPTQEARRVMRQLASDETGHAAALRAVYFLITGETYSVAVVLPPQTKQPWRDRLRGRYHEEACGGFNYARAAEETTDVCLKKLLEGLSADEYRHAETIRKLLEKAL